MRILVIGAGAVGQVYGHLAARGGAQVSVYVRESRRGEAEKGYPIVRVPLLGKRRLEHFQPDTVITSPAELAASEPFDALWSCVATSALDEAFVRDFALAAPRATLLSFQPGLGVRERWLAGYPKDRLLQGMIPFIAWHSPLHGSDDPREQLAAGTSVFFPPGSKSLISGENQRLALQVISLLRAGGQEADLALDAEADGATGSAVLMPMIGSLELAGWSLATLAEPRFQQLFQTSAAEALTVTAHETSRELPALDKLILSPLLRAVAVLGPRIMPFDVEPYLEVHFSKVGAQTLEVLSNLSERAKAAGLSHAALDELRQGLVDARTGAER